MAVATRWPLVGRRGELDAFRRALGDAGCEGLCIYGPPGVGKTRLADECIALARSKGRRALWATGDASTEGLPFSAIAHLMPAHALDGLGGDAFDPVLFAALFDTARKVLTPADDESGIPVLMLDDVHAFDASSLTVIDRLLGEGAVFCVATVVTGTPVPDTVTRWWRNERVARIDVGELAEVEVDTLLHMALEGPLDPDASADLWRASRGNVLALRELVLGARAEQVLVMNRDGVWSLTGGLQPPPRLRELIESRLVRLDATGRDVVDRLALCQPLGLGELESVAGLSALEGLERDGLITVRGDGRRESVRLAHPLHGEVLRAGMTPLRQRSLLLAEANAIETFGTRRREDPLRIATWRLEATGRADPALLVAAASLARYDHDFRRAADLARAALAAEPSDAAGLVLGEALYNLGAFDEAEQVLAAAAELATGDDHIVRIATVRRRNLFRGCRREAEAIAVGEAAAARVTSAAARDELRAGVAEVLAISGHPREALALVADVDTTVLRVRVLAAIPRAVSLAIIGRTAEAIAAGEQAYADHLALGDELGISSPGTHRVNILYAMVQSGRLDDAAEQGRAWFDIAARARTPLGVIWLGFHLARCALSRGEPATVLDWTRRVRAAIDASGFEGLRPATSALESVALAMLGDSAASAARAEEVESSTLGFGFIAPELALARAWSSIATGDIDRARSVLLAAADRAEQLEHVPSAAWLLHDSLRIGVDPEAARRLQTLATLTDSEFVAARALHAAALVSDDPHGLAGASDRFERLGARLLAAEAAATGADAWRRRREQRRAAALDVRATALVAACEGAITPALARAESVVPLTEREREIALMAAAGHSSRAIAERLVLSVRTIDNHLGRIYDKLGVSNRAELSAALDRSTR